MYIMRQKPLSSIRYATLREFMSAFGKRKRGTIERKSTAKAFSCRNNLMIAWAAQKGDLEAAERLRWEFYPEKMRAKQLAAKLGR